MERLDKMGITAIAATTESKEDAEEMARQAGVTFPVAYGVTEEDVAELGAWWTEDAAHGRYLQPTEFLVAKRRRTAFGTMYASGPIGRMSVDEVLFLLGNLDRARQRRRS